jgi:hypothetical protein
VGWFCFGCSVFWCDDNLWITLLVFSCRVMRVLYLGNNVTTKNVFRVMIIVMWNLAGSTVQVLQRTMYFVC